VPRGCRCEAGTGSERDAARREQTRAAASRSPDDISILVFFFTTGRGLLEEAFLLRGLLVAGPFYLGFF